MPCCKRGLICKVALNPIRSAHVVSAVKACGASSDRPPRVVALLSSHGLPLIKRNDLITISLLELRVAMLKGGAVPAVPVCTLT
jgi:hypothetical protein